MPTAKTHTAKLAWCITVILALACFVIPEQGFYTHQMKWFLTITVFFLSLAAFELVDNLVIAFLMPTLWIVTGAAPAATVMSPWLGTTLLMMAGAFFLAASLEDCGLLRRISYLLMIKVKGHYFSLLVSIMVCGLVVNIIASGIGYLVVGAMAYGLCKSLGVLKTRTAVGIATAAMLGTCQSHAYTYQATGWGLVMNLGAD